MNRFILFIIFITSVVMGCAQKIAKVSATYTYYAPETMSVEEAKRTALDRAKIQAIADEFGTVVSQSTSTVVTNKNGQSDTQFFSLGGSDVKGEWIETIGEPVYDLKFENHFLVVICSVKGKAREIIQAKIDFIAKPLRNGTTLKYESTEFRDGDDLYLYFKSPIDGFLSVYLLDTIHGIVYHILPYKSQNKANMMIQANMEYVFFSKDLGDRLERKEIDEYILTSENGREINTLYILFSPQEIGIKTCCENQNSSILNCMTFKEFKDWLSKSLLMDNRIQLKQFSLEIDK